MRSKSLFLMIACVCGAIAAVGASQLIQGQGPRAVVRTTDIFVASRVIEPSERITAGMMTLESWPADRVPNGTTNDLSQLEGRYAGQRFFAGEPVMTAKLLDAGDGVSVQIPDGFSVVSMRADAANSVASLVRPGDRVNVVGYFTRSDQIPETGVKTVLRDVKIFAVDGRTSRSSEAETSGTPTTVSLQIYKEDEEAWTLASELGRLRLSLSGPADAIDSEATRKCGADFLQWLREHQQASERVEVARVITAPVLAPAVAEPSVIAPPPAAEPPVAAAPVVERAPGFRMLKLHGEHWTEYEIPAGKLPAVITASSAAQPQTLPAPVGRDDNLQAGPSDAADALPLEQQPESVSLDEQPEPAVSLDKPPVPLLFDAPRQQPPRPVSYVN